MFLIHCHGDGRLALALAEELRRAGVKPWLDQEQIPAGAWIQDALQAALAQVPCAAVLIGRHVSSRWQSVEIKVAISRCIRQDIRVIPVLLPGIDSVPESLHILREMQTVRFSQTIAETGPLDALVRGIRAAVQPSAGRVSRSTGRSARSERIQAIMRET